MCKLVALGLARTRVNCCTTGLCVVCNYTVRALPLSTISLWKNPLLKLTNPRNDI